MRLARIKRQAIPLVRLALQANEITLYRAGEISRLPRLEQPGALAQWSNRTLRRSEGQAIAAGVIRRELGKTQVDLDGTLALIREAIAGQSLGAGCP